MTLTRYQIVTLRLLRNHANTAGVVTLAQVNYKPQIWQAQFYHCLYLLMMNDVIEFLDGATVRIID